MAKEKHKSRVPRIRQMIKAGKRTSEIAEACDVTPSHVSQVRTSLRNTSDPDFKRAAYRRRMGKANSGGVAELDSKILSVVYGGQMVGDLLKKGESNE